MDDLIKRLRETCEWQAADRIEAQEAEIARLREALEKATNFIGNQIYTKAGETMFAKLRQALQVTANDPA